MESWVFIVRVHRVSLFISFLDPYQITWEAWVMNCRWAGGWS